MRNLSYYQNRETRNDTIKCCQSASSVSNLFAVIAYGDVRKLVFLPFNYVHESASVNAFFVPDP